MILLKFRSFFFFKPKGGATKDCYLKSLDRWRRKTNKRRGT